jgi:hypothetical protein
MKKEWIYEGAVWGGGMLAVTLGMAVAYKLGYVDHDTFIRVVIGSNGLMMAWYGNRLPKTFLASARAREARRVAAWSQVVSGLVYAGLWMFAPISVAVAGGIAAIVVGFAITIGYCLSLESKAKGAGG